MGVRDQAGDNVKVVQRALSTLRATERLDELEPLLAFFATFVFETGLVQEIMRWDMAVLRESPWYEEILKEGIQQGIQQGLQDAILNVFQARFGPVPERVEQAIRKTQDQKDLREMQQKVALAPTREEFEQALGL